MPGIENAAAQAHAPGGRLAQTRHDLPECGLAAAALAHEGKRLARADRCVHVLDRPQHLGRPEPARRPVEFHAHRLDAQERVVRSRSARKRRHGPALKHAA
jgi:hypothetical protein